MPAAHVGVAVVEIELWQTGGGLRAGYQPFDVTVLFEDLLGHVAAGLSRPATMVHPRPESILEPRRPCHICAELVPPDVPGMRLGYASSNSAALTAEANTLGRTTRWCTDTAAQWRPRVCPDCREVADPTWGPASTTGEDVLLCRTHLLGRGRPSAALVGQVAERLREVQARVRRLTASMTKDGVPSTAAEDASWIEALGFFAGWGLPLFLAGHPAIPPTSPRGLLHHEY